MRAEPIMAYRAWRIASSGVLLSCTCDCIWKPRERMYAICNIADHEAGAPAWRCYCGLYAYKTLAALRASNYMEASAAPALFKHPPGALTVSGRVALWGRVVDHELGYRAEYAYPQVLHLRGDRLDESIRRLGDAYAIECIPPPPPGESG